MFVSEDMYWYRAVVFLIMMFSFCIFSCGRRPACNLKETEVPLLVMKAYVKWRFIPTYSEPQHCVVVSGDLYEPAALCSPLPTGLLSRWLCLSLGWAWRCGGVKILFLLS